MGWLHIADKANKYGQAKAEMTLDAHADPAVQMAQAIHELEMNHNRLVSDASHVVGGAHMLEMQLTEAHTKADATKTKAATALRLIDEANAKGDTATAERMSQAATSLGMQLTVLNQQVADLSKQYAGAQKAAADAQQAVRDSAMQLQQKVQEASSLTNQLHQAELQEDINKTMDHLHATVGQSVPTLDEVTAKVQGRLANALGEKDLQDASPEAAMLEVQHASMQIDASSALDDLRKELGMGAPAPLAIAAAPSS